MNHKQKPKDNELYPNSKDKTHCNCWWNGNKCCICNSPAMSEEQMVEQGMIETKGELI